MDGFQLEVCVERVDEAVNAALHGATRIELNQGLKLDGLTPSLAACEWVVEHCSVPTIAMVRPHSSSFRYSNPEKSCMLRDCELLLAAGVAGIACGAIREDGELDYAFIAQIANLCDTRECVVHRVFDTIADQEAALSPLVDCGVTRILTSGGQPSALSGADRIRRLRLLAGDRIQILPGGGVHSGNIRSLLDRTGCNQFHGSFLAFGAENWGREIRQTRQSLLEWSER